MSTRITQQQKLLIQSHMKTHGTSAYEAAKAFNIKLSPQDAMTLNQLGGKLEPVGDFYNHEVSAAHEKTNTQQAQNKKTKQEPKAETSLWKKTLAVVKKAAPILAPIAAGIAAGFAVGGPGGAAVGGVIGFVGASATSCAPGDEVEINNDTTTNVTLSLKAGMTAGELKDVLDQYGLSGFSKKIEELLDKIRNNTENSNINEAKIITLLNKLLEATKNNDAIRDQFNNIISILQNNTAQLDKVISLLNQIMNNEKVDSNLLKQILDVVNKNGDKMDVTNALITRLLNELKNGQITKEDLQKVIDAINNNGNKIDKTNELVDKYGAQTAVQLAQILNAINKLKGDMQNVGNDLVNKILNNLNDNTAKLLKAISNIKVEGGNVDLSSLEAMMQQLIELTKNNGEVLTDINAKMDVVNVTTKAILAQLEKMEGNAAKNFNILMEEIKNNLINPNPEKYDDTKVLDILNKILNKLDDIAGLIKDHEVHVTVDVTGKVHCECDCGGKHEGILGDLEDVLG